MLDVHDDTPSPESEAWSLPVTESFRHVRADGTERMVEFDPALWVEMDGHCGYIEGNAHTHPGRFHVCFPDQDYVTLASVSDPTAMSTEARYWLVGFLSGYELDLHEYLGRWRAIDLTEDWEETYEELIRWENFNRQFRADGWRPYPNLRPDRALVITDEERAQINLDSWRPWTYVGERVLVPGSPDGAEWVEADPQPEMDGTLLAGSACDERGHHNLIWLESSWTVCRDCGEVEVL